MSTHTAAVAPADGDVSEVHAQIARARAAQAAFEAGADQERYDTAALAAGWALMQPERNRELSELAVATTGLGNVADKITKNHRKTLGLLRDLKDAKTCGVISDDPATGITRIARPVGVVAAVVPSTNPVATPTNNIVNALKCGNAIVLSPSPKGAEVCEKLLGYIHAEFDRNGIDHDLVQMISRPSTKQKTQALMEAADLLVVTGSQDNVRRAYSSGTPAVGVGAGNVTVIVDETADLAAAAQKIAASKTFDNATSCSSENALVVVDAVYDDFLAALHVAGGRLLSAETRETLKTALFQQGHLSRDIIAKDIDHVVDAAGLGDAVDDAARFLIIEGSGVGPEHPESGEKLSLVLTLYRVADFAEAQALTARILTHQGAGHSVGLHSADDARAVKLGHELPTCRVIVNQAHCFATGGSFDNGMPFSLSMGCGSWGGNSIDDNLNYRHFMNITKVVRTIPANEPALEDIFGAYWASAGK
jgi:sulfoacetaldehyde dehydrogenase